MVSFITLLFVTCLNLILMAWVVSKEAERRGVNSTTWAIIILFTGVVGIILFYATTTPKSHQIGVITCSNCGVQNRETRNYCEKCSEEITDKKDTSGSGFLSEIQVTAEIHNETTGAEYEYSHSVEALSEEAAEQKFRSHLDGIDSKMISEPEFDRVN